MTQYLFVSDTLYKIIPTNYEFDWTFIKQAYYKDSKD